MGKIDLDWQTRSLTRIEGLYLGQIRWENNVNIEINFKKYGVRVSIGFFLAGSCEHNNKLPSSVLDWSSLDPMGNYIKSS